MASLYVVLVLLTFAGHSYALEAQSSGAGGAVCGDRVCLKDEASCVGGNCVCNNPPFPFGNGFLNCYKKNEFRTEVTNDPRILTYNNHSIDLPIPCRYLLTHAVTEYKDQNRNVVGSCEFMVHPFHKKALGKFYVGGYDVAIRVECNNGSRYEMSFRKYGEAHNGSYDFYINATDGDYLPNGPFGNDDINFHDPKTNLKVKCRIDQNNNLAKIIVKRCGFRIRFRPYDIVKRRQQGQVPGIAAAFNCAFHPEYESLDRVLALPPLSVHNGFDINSIEIPGLGRMGTMIYRAYMSGVLQTQPIPNPACSGAKDALEQCGSLYSLQMAFNNCLWILRSPRFIKCYDKSESGIDIQYLFNTCVDIYCSGTSVCSEILFLMYEEDCDTVPGYPDMQNFIANCI